MVDPRFFSYREVKQFLDERTAQVRKQFERYSDYDELKFKASEYDQLKEKLQIKEEKEVSEQQLKAAGEKARRTGDHEDVAAYATLKQKINGGNTND